MTLFSATINRIFFLYYKLLNKNIPDTDHIVRYLRPSDIDSGAVIASGFSYKKNISGALKERELSVNWLEYINRSASAEDGIQNIRQAFQKKSYSLKKNGRFVILNVKTLCDLVKEGTSEHTDLVFLRAKHTPFLNDLSHSSIFGMPFDSDGELLVSAILANYANEEKLFPALSADCE